MQKVNLTLNKTSYGFVRDALLHIVNNDLELNSLEEIVLYEFYVQKIAFFSLWRPNGKGKMKLTMLPSVAVSLHYHLNTEQYYIQIMMLDFYKQIINYVEKIYE